MYLYFHIPKKDKETMKLNNLIEKVAGNKKLQFWLFFGVLVLLSLHMVNQYTLLCKIYGHDYYFHYARFNALIEALRSGTFPVYIDSTSIDGYGYLTKYFYSDFILIPFALIAIYTDVITAFQVLIFTTTVLCGVFTYITVNKISGSSFAATVSAILYTFCLYRLVDVYHRFALGEAISFTFIPIVFWGLYHIIKGDYKKWYIIAIGFSLLIFTHVLSTFLTFATMLLILAINYKSLKEDPKRMDYLVLAGCVTILVTAYYLFPMIEQMLSNSFYYKTNETIYPRYNRLENDQLISGLFGGFVYPKALFMPAIGALLSFGIFIRIFVYKKSAAIRYADIGLIIGLFYIFVSSIYFPWEKFPFYEFSFIQFPWRLFEFTSYFFAVAIGIYISSIIKTPYRVIGIIFITITMTIAMLYSDSKFYEEIVCRNTFNKIEKSKAINTSNTSNRFNIYIYYQMGNLEYIPAKVPAPDYVYYRGDSVIAKQAATVINNLRKEKGITTLSVQTDKPDKLELPLFYYKGYAAYLNDKEIPVNESDNGLVEIPVSEPGDIKVYYAGTPVQKGSWYITLISILAFAFYIFYSRRNKNGSYKKDAALPGEE